MKPKIFQSFDFNKPGRYGFDLARVMVLFESGEVKRFNNVTLIAVVEWADAIGPLPTTMCIEYIRKYNRVERSNEINIKKIKTVTFRNKFQTKP